MQNTHKNGQKNRKITGKLKITTGRKKKKNATEKKKREQNA